MQCFVEAKFWMCLPRLSNEDRGRVATFLGKFHDNPAQPGVSLERLERAKSHLLWSARISKDLRAIIYREGDEYALIYAGHHDDAYAWAERYNVERHSNTGALQVVELPVVAAKNADAAKAPSSGLFARHKDAYLLSLGVPELWLPTIRQIVSQEDLFDVIPKIPEDVAERLFELAAGKLVTPPEPIRSLSEAAQNPLTAGSLFDVRSEDDIQRLINASMAKWIAFLHPTQHRLAYGQFNGPVKVTGSAGTGKTVVALHRARHLAGQGKRVLMTSFVQTLCHNLRRNLNLLCSAEENRLITVNTVHTQAQELLDKAGKKLRGIGNDEINKMLAALARSHDCPLNAAELEAEWESVIQAQGITTWDAYRGASRAGRGRPLSIKDRKAVWQIVEKLYAQLERERLSDYPGLCRRAADLLESRRIKSPYDAVIVDEMQDLGMQELRMIAALAGEGPDRLMIAGDGGQRIYSAKASLKSVGIDVRGRSHILRLNYRTTEQIRRFADGLLGEEADDFEGGKESRRGTRSLLTGPAPILKPFASRSEQCDFVAEQIRKVLDSGRALDEIAVFAYQASLLEMLETRLRRAGIPHHRLNRDDFPEEPVVHLGTMFRAKGLEYKVVFVIDADDEHLPLASALRKKADEDLRQQFIEQARNLLYVSITRARDVVFVTWAGKPSRFLPEADTESRA